MRTISQLLLTFILNSWWQIVLITIVAFLFARIISGFKARYRHSLWVAALIVASGIPALTSIPFSSAPHFTKPPRSNVPQAEEDFVIAPQLNLETKLQAAAPKPASISEMVSFIGVNRNVAFSVIALYLLFLLYRSCKLLLAWKKAWNLKRRASPIDLSDSVLKTIDECRSALGVDNVRVRWSSSISIPVAVGAIRPMIVLPDQLLQETDSSVLTAAIGHELAHVLRRDYLLNLVYEIISLPLLFHPGVAFIKRRIRETRELSCDELVTEKLLDATTYARSLVQLAGSAVNFNRPGATITVGIADADILEERVMTILENPKSDPRRKSLLIAAAALVFAIPCAAAAQFAFRISINQATAVLIPRPADLKPQAAVSTSQQVAGIQTTQETQAREERKAREAREEALKRHKAEQEARQDEQTLGVAFTQEQEEREKRKIREFQERERAEREMKESDPELMARRKLERVMMARRQAELAKKANITMQQAIQIAMSQQSGTVMECRLIGERMSGDQEQVLYILTLVSGDDSDSATTRLLISAVDGKVVKTWKDEK